MKLVRVGAEEEVLVETVRSLGLLWLGQGGSRSYHNSHVVRDSELNHLL